MKSLGDGKKESQEKTVRRLLRLLTKLPGLRWLSGDRNAGDDPLNKVDEAYGKLEESKYKAEVELVDRYQSFVAELLRLSLLGIAVFGFLYKEMFADLGASPLFSIVTAAKLLAALGVVAFAVAAVAALIFRFAATEGARYYIEGLRFEGLRFREDIKDIKDKTRAQESAKESLENRYDKIIIARLTKPLAGIFLGLGGVLVAVSMALLLFS